MQKRKVSFTFKRKKLFTLETQERIYLLSRRFRIGRGRHGCRIPRLLLLARRIARITVGELAVPVECKEYITSAPEILHGKPRLKGTRIPASRILGLSGGWEDGRGHRRVP